MIDLLLGFGWLFIAAIAGAFALVIWLRSLDWRGELRLPRGQVIYADNGVWYRQEETLYSSEYRLAGRPDFLVEQDMGEIIPVEVKSSAAPPKPYDSHIMQLAAYCLLVEDNYGVRPSHGIVQYRNQAFAVDYTEELEYELIEIMSEMREVMFEDDLERDHDDVRRCLACGFQEACDDSLT